MRYDQFAKTVYAPMQESDVRIVPDFDSIHRPHLNAALTHSPNPNPNPNPNPK